jgi:DNA-binding NarL/FixJ family response regulator
VIRVLIVARVPLVREGLRALLAGERDLQVSALARVESGVQIEDMLAQRPDVVLLDVDVLEREGWALLRELQDLAPGIGSLVVGDAPDDRRVANALALGARGYLLREQSPEGMAAAIRAAAQGLFVLHPNTAAALLNQLRSRRVLPSEDRVGDESADEASVADLIEPLSPRELDVLRLMVRGLPNKQIAAELIITEHTVKFHIRAILAKLGASNRTEAVTLALQKGLVTL